ncbi:MAG: RNA polymerase sigma factor [Nitrospirae bacterium]|nr:RNA polymerase sigma factor [Nitrospirota bacterium]
MSEANSALISKLPDIFEDIIPQQQQYIYNLALRLCGNAVDADDLTQDTFLKAIEGYNQFRSEANVRTWLTRIMINVFLDSKRKERPHVSLDMGTIPCPANDPERVIIRKELQWCVQHVLLHHVPEEQKIVLVLRDIYGHSYQEIAGIMRISVAAVKSRLHRGRTAFYDHLVRSGCVGFVKDYTCYCEGVTQYEMYL